MSQRVAALVLAGAVAATALPAAAQAPGEVASAQILGGWREPSGQHIAAVRITLAPGWKTYWRAPGEAGIPPEFDWSASHNVRGVTPLWPVPHVFWQNGMRSVGYSGSVVLPLVVAPAADGQAMHLSGRIDIGVCEDVCVPVTIELSGDLPALGAPDPAISTAMSARPLAAAAAGVTAVTCAVEPIADGLRVTASVHMPALGPDEAAVVEVGDPSIWVSEPVTHRAGGVLHATAEMVPPNGRPFAIDRSAIRITVLAGETGVDIRGCTGR
jgi:DsbC/DsbD-like thiol-disulfide interchange protein